MDLQLESILIQRHYVFEGKKEELSEKEKAYYNAFLFANFGITLDKPELVNRYIIQTIQAAYLLKVPSSFYKNPQDLKYFSCDELFLEQLVSYFVIEANGVKNENNHFERIKLFEKELPKYLLGKEMVERKFYVLTKEEVDSKLEEITANYAAYKRPFSIDEKNDFLALFNNGYYKNFDIQCKDNILLLFYYIPELAKKLDYKDVVKLSKEILGEWKTGLKESFDELKDENKEKLNLAYKNAHKCPLSKTQAKYYNKVAKLLGDKKKMDNSDSPYVLAKKELDKGNVLGAAKIFLANGSLFERNIKMLLSRAKPQEINELVNMLPDKNPAVLIQLSDVTKDTPERRTFIFYKYGLVLSHTETEYEALWRKSDLTDEKKTLLNNAIKDRLYKYYDSLEKLGKIYVSDEFKKIGTPINTSSSGKGIDVLPLGSRLPIEKDYIRTFVYWVDTFDIDSSLLLMDTEGEIHSMGFWNYNQKEFGDSCLCSGDDRSDTGAEYYDIKLSELKEKGFTKIVQTFYGFIDNLNIGTIKAGFQYKDDLDTKAWDPKNIQMEMNINGDTRACASFGIDLETNEIVILNQMLKSEVNALDEGVWSVIDRYLDKNYLDINMYTILMNRGEVVNDPLEADIVFDRNYSPKDNQKVIRPFDIESLVLLVNGGKIELNN